MIFVSASQFYVYLPYLNDHFNKVKAFSGHCENFTKPSLTALSPSGSCWFANQPSGGTQQNAAAYKRYEASYSCYDEEDWRRYWVELEAAPGGRAQVLKVLGSTGGGIVNTE